MTKATKLQRYYYTIHHLKFKQIYYRFFYLLKKVFFRTFNRNLDAAHSQSFPLSLDPSIPSPTSYAFHAFTFLNCKKVFSVDIDWNYMKFGKLWSYNLNYFDFLNQKEIQLNEALNLINSFCNRVDDRREGTEPYPISLRGINWIKFFSYKRVTNSFYNQVLFSHYHYLYLNLEYHLLGNHLLENGFSLFFAAYYFRNEKFYKKSENILRAELNEQILKDGAHFELSPMYHQILLFRLLDTINVVKNNSWKHSEMLSFLNSKAALMLGWLKEITFLNGDVPLVNDAAYYISPSSEELLEYARRLDLVPTHVSLSSSGYRMIRIDKFELFIDVGNIGPDYIPGHAHSDTFNFILYLNGSPVIVDTGTSTYEKGPTRLSERSTQSHNTVTINDLQQSDVWSSFRVGRRAKIIQMDESKNGIAAIHNGYEFIGLRHKRSWQWKENVISITDEIIEKKQNIKSFASFHFHPSVNVEIIDGIVSAGDVKLVCDGQNLIKIEDYNYAAGFNKTVRGKVVRISFTHDLNTKITFDRTVNI